MYTKFTFYLVMSPHLSHCYHICKHKHKYIIKCKKNRESEYANIKNGNINHWKKLTYLLPVFPFEALNSLAQNLILKEEK